jgi:hypothetical protein
VTIFPGRRDHPRESLAKELELADARDSKDLRAALGSHYQEYTLMHGHFAEAALDHKPFEPRVFEPVPPRPPAAPGEQP